MPKHPLYRFAIALFAVNGYRVLVAMTLNGDRAPIPGRGEATPV